MDDLGPYRWGRLDRYLSLSDRVPYLGNRVKLSFSDVVKSGRSLGRCCGCKSRHNDDCDGYRRHVLHPHGLPPSNGSQPLRDGLSFKNQLTAGGTSAVMGRTLSALVKSRRIQPGQQGLVIERGLDCGDEDSGAVLVYLSQLQQV